MTTFEDGDNSITNQIFDCDWNEAAAALWLRPCVMEGDGAIYLGDNDAIMTNGNKLSLNSLSEAVMNYLSDKYVLPDGFHLTAMEYQNFIEGEISLITDVQKM